uniref:Uncharacterized protein n=1 Tax=Oryza barthii TaxID=65489 RepID=A0A0D3H8R7_9ORYZ
MTTSDKPREINQQTQARSRLQRCVLPEVPVDEDEQTKLVIDRCSDDSHSCRLQLMHWCIC